MGRFKLTLLLFVLPLALSVDHSAMAQSLVTDDLRFSTDPPSQFPTLLPSQLGDTLAATGIGAPTILDVDFQAFLNLSPLPPPTASIGEFRGAAGILGPDFDSGVILSSGRISDVTGSSPAGTNEDDASGTGHSSPDLSNDPFLDNLFSGFRTVDATSLEIAFTCPAGFDIISINYVFASDEYNEHVGSGFNDMFAIILDEGSNNEQNIALLPDGLPVAINYVNGGNPLGQHASNADAFINNDPSDGSPAFDFEPDGFTVVLTATGSLGEDAGPHRIRFVIADGYPEGGIPNSFGDSWVFLPAESLRCAQSTASSENIPPIALCMDRTVAADPKSCVAKADVDAGSVDPDGDPITLRQSFDGPFDLGETSVTLTVTDDLGTSESCRATVTVVDTTPPSVSCRALNQKKSGFYRVTSSDCSLTTLSFGNRKLAEGKSNDETIKLTWTPGRRSIRPINKHHFQVPSGDVVIKATDTAGNIATAICPDLSPPKSRAPKQAKKSRSPKQAKKSRGHRR